MNDTAETRLMDSTAARLKAHRERNSRLTNRMLDARSALNQMIADGKGATQEELYALRALLSTD